MDPSSSHVKKCPASETHEHRAQFSRLGGFLGLKDSFRKKAKSKYSGRASPDDLPSLGTQRHPWKRAVLCGVAYQGFKYKLKGTINDVYSMKSLLMRNFGYREENILVLTEKEGSALPTKKNIQTSLKWLVEGSEAGDTLVFYFSGHGLRQVDMNDDELDGYDETICPLFFQTEGMIMDDEINTTIVWPLKKGVTLHAIVDACHSGTILDLEYTYNRNKKAWEDNSAPSKARKNTDGGLAVCLSACGDDQLAADTSAFTQNEMAGALTCALIKAVNDTRGLTYGTLLEKVHETFESFNNERILGSKFLSKLFCRKILQVPLLSSSEKFPVDSTEFRL